MRSQVESQSKLLEESVGICQQHQSVNELACVTCKQRICPHCALFGGHKGHEVKEEKEAQEIIQNNSEQLKLLMNEFSAMATEISGKQNYWKFFDKYRAKKEELKVHIQNEFKRWRKALRALEMKVLDKLHNNSFAQFEETFQKAKDGN